MSLKILFLDVDGVLNSADRRANEPGDILYGRLGSLCGIDRTLLGYLKDILREVPDLKIVVSSTWRLFHMNDLKWAFRKEGIDWWNIVIGKTPRSNVGYRGKEIQAWIKENVEESFSFAIVDDDADMTPFQTENCFFKTHWDTGLTEEIRDKIIQHFKVPQEYLVKDYLLAEDLSSKPSDKEIEFRFEQ